MNYKKLCMIFFINIFLLLLVVCLISYKADRYQIFDMQDPYDPEKFSGNMRIDALAIINKIKFDSIIFGTSVLDNTSSIEASEKLGEKFINISMSASNYYERSIILNYIFKRQNLKSIIYSFDTFYFTCPTTESIYKPELWEYLYDDIRINDVKIYLSRKHLRQNLKYFIASIKNKKDRKKNMDINKFLDRPCSEYDKDLLSERFGGIDNWTKNWDKMGAKNFILNDLPSAALAGKQKIMREVHDIEKEQLAREYVEKYILKYVKQYPQTNFYIICPPYFRYQFANMIQNHTYQFYLHQYIIKYMVEQSKIYKNLFIFGFEDCNFIEDISKYKDTTHYDAKINSYIIDCIKNNNHLLTMNNIIQYFKKCKNLAFNYDLNKLNEQFKESVWRIYNIKLN